MREMRTKTSEDQRRKFKAMGNSNLETNNYGRLRLGTWKGKGI